MKLTKREAQQLGLMTNDRDPMGRKLPGKDNPVRKACAKPGSKAKKGSPQAGDTLFRAQCLAHGLPPPVNEYPFAESIGRKWRFDWLFDGWLALEIQGGLFTEGRHVRGAALLAEYEKLNEATIMGYAILLVTPEQVKTGEVFALVKRAIYGKEEQP